MPTSGPIVRTGATPEFWKNYDNIFGPKKKGSGGAATTPAKKKASAAKAGSKKAKSASKRK